MTPTEDRLYKIVMRLVSTLTIIKLSHEAGHTAVSLEGNLHAVHTYLQTTCPSLHRFVEIVYRGEEIPYGLASQAMAELGLDG
ncbi:MAG TPA: hypothetical protein PLZ36_13230 [Armatimonadota bacterium]|nr:hypothetical protein [Armatimonadota bacterium]